MFHFVMWSWIAKVSEVDTIPFFLRHRFSWGLWYHSFKPRCSWILKGSYQSLLTSFRVLQCRIECSQLGFFSFFLLIAAQLQVNIGKESFIGYVVYQYFLFCPVSITHTLTFRWQFKLSSIYKLSTMLQNLCSCYRVKYSLHWERNVLLDNDKSNRSIPLFQTQYWNENKTHQHWSGHFSSVCL